MNIKYPVANSFIESRVTAKYSDLTSFLPKNIQDHIIKFTTFQYKLRNFVYLSRRVNLF